MEVGTAARRRVRHWRHGVASRLHTGLKALRETGELAVGDLAGLPAPVSVLLPGVQSHHHRDS